MNSDNIGFNPALLRKLSATDKVVISKLRREGTKAEDKLWSIVRKDQILGVRFRRQHKIGQFILDFFSMKCQLGIEVDGEIHAQQIQQDAARTQWLESQGIRVIRFSNDEVFADSDLVRTKIEKAVSEQLLLNKDPSETPSL